MLKKGIVYYTDNRLDPVIMSACQRQISHCADAWGMPIVSVSLKPIDFGINIVFPAERGYLTLFKQILAGIEALDADVVFFAEHDVLYHPSHFDFVPQRPDTFYYDMNTWVIRTSDGHALYYDHKSQSAICVYRETGAVHYRERIELVEREGYSTTIGFEPMTHGRIRWNHMFRAEGWKAPYPSLDLKHGGNLTKARWDRSQWRDQRNCQNWMESDSVPGWGVTKNRFAEILAAV